MGYNKTAFLQTQNEFSDKLNKEKEASMQRTEVVYARIPELRMIDTSIASAWADITIEIAAGRDGIEERIAVLREKNLALQSKRTQLLLDNGLPSDFTDVKYQCSKCKDSGFDGINICNCFKKQLIRNTIKLSGLEALAPTHKFEKFDLSYFTSDPQDYKIMQANLEFTKEYAENFNSESGGLLLIGRTGLGKTHLSVAIGCKVIEKGYDVLYNTAQNILSDFEYERFGKSYNTGETESKTDKYFNCDLLIIDDLGTELVNNFTLSSFYNLINTRINNGKPMIISTNYLPKELRSKYDERITSRLFGSFDSVMFSGTDVRQQKLHR